MLFLHSSSLPNTALLSLDRTLNNPSESTNPNPSEPHIPHNLGEILQRLGVEGSNCVDGHVDAKITDVAFDLTGNVLYSCATDGCVVEWDVTSGTVLKRTQADKTSLSKLALSHDGASLLTASTSIKLWDLSSMQVRHP